MKRQSTLAVLLLSLLVGSNLSRGQDGSGPGPKRPRAPEDYKPRTLKEVAAEKPGAESRGDKAETVRVEADILPSRVTVRNANSSRPLPPEKKEVLRRWARLYAGFPEGFAAPYETEMLFEEDGVKYWLAVRRDAQSAGRRDEQLDRLARELHRGAEFELCLIRVGAAKIADKWEPVLLVESKAWVIRGH